MLAACGQKPDDAAATASNNGQRKAAQSQSSADPFVKAVVITVGESPVELSFELPERPVPNQPVPLNLRLTGLFDSTILTVKLAGNEQIQVMDGADWSLDALPAGQAQAHGVSVRAKSTGVYVLDASVEATRDNFAKTYSFAIPVAVPDPAAAASSSSASQ